MDSVFLSRLMIVNSSCMLVQVLSSGQFLLGGTGFKITVMRLIFLYKAYNGGYKKRDVSFQGTWY